MTKLRDVIREDISKIEPLDDTEKNHQQDVFDWIKSGAQLFRVSKPDNPPKHLVSYFILFDETSSSVMLVDHINAKLWLPTGGHVDDNEHPYQTVIREANEELKIKADFNTPFSKNPFFVTITKTKGQRSHTDVSLWYVIKGDSTTELDFDTNEMNSCKWMTFEEVLDRNLEDFDPHMHRFIKKMKQELSL